MSFGLLPNNELAQGQLGFRVVELVDNLKVGRRRSSDIFIDSESVSGEHGRFERRGDKFWYVDTKSLNGAMINGTKIGGHRAGGESILQVGDLLQICGFAFEIVEIGPKNDTVVESMTVTFSDQDLQPPST